MRIVIILLGLIFGSLLMVSCDSGGSNSQSTGVVSPVSSNVLSQRRLIHESELAKNPALRADLVNSMVITRMEMGPSSGDLGQTGVDEVPYLLKQAETLHFKLETPNVSEATLLSGSNRLFTLKSGQDITVWLPAGEYRLRLTNPVCQDSMRQILSRN